MIQIYFFVSNNPGGCVTDIVLHSLCANGEEGSAAIMGLICSFMKGGGFSVQFNVLSSDLLKKAKRYSKRISICK